MNHLVLFLVCVLSVEIFVRFNFLAILDSILKATQKVILVIPKDNVSDHWKEKVVPAYALKIMKFSLQLLLILSCILSLFFIVGFFLHKFLLFTLSYMGIIESMFFAFGCLYLRKFIVK